MGKVNIIDYATQPITYVAKGVNIKDDSFKVWASFFIVKMDDFYLIIGLEFS